MLLVKPGVLTGLITYVIDVSNITSVINTWAALSWRAEKH